MTRLILWLLMVAVSCSGCALLPVGLRSRSEAANGVRPTFTSAPGAPTGAVTDSLLASRSATFTAMPTITLTPTVTATPAPPTATPTATITPTPGVIVEVMRDDTVVRSGPSPAYPQLGQVEKGTALTVTGRNRKGDWWRVCCYEGADAWIHHKQVEASGRLWIVQEVTGYPPPPTPEPTAAPPPRPEPTPTVTWRFRLERGPERYPLGSGLFMVAAAVHDGATPHWGYKLRVRLLSTGKEWISNGSDAFWTTEPVDWSKDRRHPIGVKRNVKWDSSVDNVAQGDDSWEVTVVDGGGSSVSAPVRIQTSSANPSWYYLAFTDRR